MNYNVIIIGAGMVGLAQALALASLPLSILVLDTQALTDDIDLSSYDLRVSAITPATEYFFKQLNIWQTLSEHRVSPFYEMAVFDKTGQIRFSGADVGETRLGHIVENSIIQKILLKKLRQFTNVSLQMPCQVKDIIDTEQGVNVNLQDGSQISCQLLIAADGANSWVREKLNFELLQQDYDQTAIVANVHCELPHNYTAWQQFLPTGPLAFLPLENLHLCSIVWSCQTTFFEEIKAVDNELFAKKLTDYIQPHLGKITLASSRINFPLKMRNAKQYVKPHVALIGDAAHTLHPLAGQGANLGFYDVIALTYVIKQTLARKRPLGNYLDLRKYERNRKTRASEMISLMSGFKQLFGNDIPYVSNLRNKGLNLVDTFPMLKNIFIRQALGYQFLDEN